MTDQQPTTTIEKMERPPTSNTPDVFRYAIGRTVVGILLDTLPLGRPDLSEGTRSLVFDDGTALTMNSRGAYWIDRAEDVDRAIAHTRRKLESIQRDIKAVLDLAGQRASHNERQ